MNDINMQQNNNLRPNGELSFDELDTVSGGSALTRWLAERAGELTGAWVHAFRSTVGEDFGLND